MFWPEKLKRVEAISANFQDNSYQPLNEGV